MRKYTHKNGDEIALPVVLPFVQFLREAGGYDRRLFCFAELVSMPSLQAGVLHLFQVAAKLPERERFAARDLLERHLHLVPQLTAAVSTAAA